MLRAMTYNIHHGVGTDGRLDLARIADLIAGSGADVIGLQEVDRYFSDRSGYVDQAGWLADRLSMDLAYGASLDLDPGGPDQPRRQYGNALLSRHPIDECRTALLPRGEGPEDRGLMCARVTVRGQLMHVHNTHLHNASPRGRLAQARQVRHEIGTPAEPVILLGDFNAAPDTPEVREIGRGLVDAWRRAGSGPGWTFPAKRPRVRIDYVLTSPELAAVSATVLDTLGSDHRPVLVELRPA